MLFNLLWKNSKFLTQTAFGRFFYCCHYGHYSMRSMSACDNTFRYNYLIDDMRWKWTQITLLIKR